MKTSSFMSVTCMLYLFLFLVDTLTKINLKKKKTKHLQWMQYLFFSLIVSNIDKPITVLKISFLQIVISDFVNNDLQHQFYFEYS